MLAIIDYGSGNLRSAAKALERVGADARVTRAPADLKSASHIVLPGVGAFADCMQGLSAIPGMLAALEEEVLSRKKLFLGICVGMQMLFETGHEHGTHKGLGWLKGEVVPLVGSASLKIPHMGWNALQIPCPHPLLRGIENGNHAYFVHSYRAVATNPETVLATTAYGQTIAAVVGQGNIFGTQFHPEKSQETGLRLLKNFVDT
jgi:imidazole glycerol-phosphate synthase subunit HisH